MAERFPDDTAGVNGARCSRGRPGCSMAPPDVCLPLGWNLSAGGIPILPVPTNEDIADEIQAAIAAMEEPGLVEDPGHLVFREKFFADRRLQELAHHEGPPSSPPKCNNVASCRRWWIDPGRTLVVVLEHIHAGNNPRLGM